MPKNTSSLKIGFVLDDGLDSTDGVQQNILTLGSWLTEQGHEVWYLVGETKRTDIENTVTLSRNFRVKFNSNILTIPFFSSKKQIQSFLNKKKFDVLHIQVPYHPFMGARIVKYANPKTTIIGTFHILPAYGAAKYGSRILGIYLNRNLKKFDMHTAVSKPAADFAKWSFNIECLILPNPIKLNYQPKIVQRGTETNIVFLGRLVRRKGCNKLLEAIVKLKKTHPEFNIKVNIYGDGPDKESLIGFCAKNNISEFVKFQGYIAEKNKFVELNKADIAVFPSLGGESFGIVLVEAIAAGAKVVLASNNSGYANTLSQSPECLFDPNDPDFLAELIYKYSTNKQLAKNLQSKQKKLIKQYDVNTVGRKLLDVYYNSIDNKLNT